MKKKFDPTTYKYIQFDPQRIDRDVPWMGVKNQKLPSRRINVDQTWPNVEKMIPGDSFCLYHENPKQLVLDMIRLSKKITGKELKDNHLKAIEMADGKGIIVVKY